MSWYASLYKKKKKKNCSTNNALWQNVLEKTQNHSLMVQARPQGIAVSFFPYNCYLMANSEVNYANCVKFLSFNRKKT